MQNYVSVEGKLSDVVVTTRYDGETYATAMISIQIGDSNKTFGVPIVTGTWKAEELLAFEGKIVTLSGKLVMKDGKITVFVSYIPSIEDMKEEVQS